MVTVVVDQREPKVMAELLASCGVAVDVERLRVGDYSVGPGSLVERKHVVDLHHTIVTGRFWRQIGALRRAADPYLLVEGADLRGPVRLNAVRGALLAVIDLGVAVIRSADRCDSASWLASLARQRQARPKPRVRPHYAQRPRSPKHDPAEPMLCAVPSIGPDTARALLERFGSVLDLAHARPDEWLAVHGMGERRAAALAEALGATSAPSHSVRRNGCPST